MEKISFKVGDIVKVTIRNPKDLKVRATPFEGTVIALKGSGSNKTITLRKLGTARVAVERIFPLNSPFIEKITVVKSNKVRRAKLYYLRNKS